MSHTWNFQKFLFTFWCWLLLDIFLHILNTFIFWTLVLGIIILWPALVQSAVAIENTVFISAEWKVLPPPSECPGYDTRPSDGEASNLEHWGMWSNPSIPLLSGSFWCRVVVPDRVLSMAQIKLFGHLNCVQTNDLC